MKRIFLVSSYIIASLIMVSCTNDDVETTPNTSSHELRADDPGDGDSGQIPTKPPKPQA